MKIAVPQKLRLSLAVTIAALVALALAPAQAMATPVLTIEGNCDDYPSSSSIDMSIDGLPPFEPFTGTLWTLGDDGTFHPTFGGPLSFTADKNGSASLNAPFGAPHTYKVTVVWSGGTVEATTEVNCAGPPGTPIADAGDDQTVAPQAAAALDGTGSSDPDGDPLTYSWTQVDGPPVTLSGAKTATPSYTSPAGPAELTFRLEVCDDSSPALCDDNKTTVKVMGPPPTEPPTLTLTKDCGFDPPRIELRLRGLAGYGSFTIELPGLFDSPFSFRADENGNFGFSMEGITKPTAKVVWSGGTLEATAPDECTVVPGTPTADAGADQTVAPGATVDLDGTGSSDPDGDPLTYSWTQTDGPTVTLSGAGTATPSFTTPTAPGNLIFRLMVCDDGSPALCDTDTVAVAPPVVPGNDYAARVIVNQPTWANEGGHRHARGFTVKVTNLDDGPFAVTADDIAREVLVNGVATGSAKLVSTRVVKLGKRVKFHYLWRYGGVAAGDAIEYSGCVNFAGDPNAGNDCGSHTTTAEEKP